MAQTPVNWLIKCTLKYFRNILYDLLNLKKLFEMRSSVFVAQLKTLCYRPRNLLAGLYLNMPVSTREYFGLTDFWATLYDLKLMLSVYLFVDYLILLSVAKVG
jgi:hypothetical protein